VLGKVKRLEPKLFYTGLALEDRIPAGHLLRRIQEQIDLRFVREEVSALYGRCGHESLDPIVLVKLMLVLFLEQVPSERALMEQMPYRLDWLWFCGYDLDEEVPHHSVLSKARRRWGPEVFVRLFQRVLRQCVDAGLVDGRLVHVDGSIIRADASMDSLQPDLQLVSEALYAGLEQSNEVEAPDDPVARDEPDASGKPDAGGEPASSPPAGQLVSSTDPDARLTRKNGKTVLGYKEHRVVDDACGIVTATVTTDAAVDEAHMLTEVLDQHRINSGCVEQTVVADKGYGTREVYKSMHRRGVRPCIPHQRHGGTHGTFASERFRYDEQHDEYICPAGHRLKRKPARRRRRSDTPVRYYADADRCQSCPLREQCTKNANGRTIVRDPDQWYVEWADGCGSRAERRRLQGRRRVVAEGSFADAANNHGFKRARWRRLWRVEIQNLLIATAQNLRKLVRALGRGPRRSAVALATVASAACARWCHRFAHHGRAEITPTISNTFRTMILIIRGPRSCIPAS